MEGNMIAIIITIVLLVLIVMKMRWDEKQRKQRMRAYLQRTWGHPDEREYDDKQWEAITYYAQCTSRKHDMDDTTWNDLDGDLVFQKWNHTRTSMGEEYLYAMLRHMETDLDQLAERERIISFLQEHKEERDKLQEALADIGKANHWSVYKRLCQIENMPSVHKWQHIAQALLLVICLLGCLVNPAVMVLVSIVVMGVNIVSYYAAKSKLEGQIHLFPFVLRMIVQCKDLANIAIPELQDYQDKLQQNAKCFRKFCRCSYLVSGGNQMGGDIMDSLMDYVRMLTHVDLIKIGTMIEVAREQEQRLKESYEIIGFLDSMLSIASAREMYPTWCAPKLQQKKSFIHSKELYHPLLEDGVGNDFSTDKSVLLTGSNASGKSTFIKAVALNAVLAQTFHTVVASEYESSLFEVASSMALRDDISNGESYYIVEINSIRRLFQKEQEAEVPMLCFIDEVLRGTNTVERIAASSSILEYLSAGDHLCIAATHDVELTYLLEEKYDNYHFQEKVTENDVQFDYLLHEGRANSSNAIRLLEVIGYPTSLVEEAKQRAASFLKSGTWSNND